MEGFKPTRATCKAMQSSTTSCVGEQRGCCQPSRDAFQQQKSSSKDLQPSGKSKRARHPQTVRRKLQNSTRIALLRLNCIMSTSRRDNSEKIIHQKLGWLFDYVEFIVLPTGGTTFPAALFHITLLLRSPLHHH